MKRFKIDIEPLEVPGWDINSDMTLETTTFDFKTHYVEFNPFSGITRANREEVGEIIEWLTDWCQKHDEGSKK